MAESRSTDKLVAIMQAVKDIHKDASIHTLHCTVSWEEVSLGDDELIPCPKLTLSFTRFIE